MEYSSTHFCAAGFINTQSTEVICKMIQFLWTHVYMAPPDLFPVDQGTSYTSRGISSKYESDGIKLLEAPIENLVSIGTV